MLDQVDEDSLDLVDEVIFDGGACRLVRQEALSFMMDHTEGFEVRDRLIDVRAVKGRGGEFKVER